MKPRVLFILKYRAVSGGIASSAWNQAEKKHVDPTKGLSSGLLNSARFVVEMLAEQHIDVKLVQVIDNNAIDREVYQYKPTHVVIEALWVVPEKFAVLQRLHPNVKWIIRGHSEIPFLANEGVAINWITKYVQYENVCFAANSEASVRDLRSLIQSANPTWSREKIHKKVVLLPNWYPHHKKHGRHKKDQAFFDVACFGAIRPLKNQLIQALAAIEYADMMGKQLRFHINATRTEQRGDNVLKNLRAMFEATGHELVEHEWMEHHHFLKLLQTMDMALQVSFSETFNIVAADCVVSGLPIVVSPEVTWATSWCQAEPTSSEDIVLKMIKANDWRLRLAMKVLNLRGLRHYCEDSKSRWTKFLMSSHK